MTAAPQGGEREVGADEAPPKRWRWLDVWAVTLSAAAICVSIWAAINSSRQSQEGLAVQRFQSVYDRQLQLHQLRAEHPTVAAYMSGRLRRPTCDPSSSSSGAERTPLQKRCAAEDAVFDYAVDFFNYTYFQVQEQLPSVSSCDEPLALSLVANQPDDPDQRLPPRPDCVDEADWADWTTWSETIAFGFVARATCRHLRGGRAAYHPDFVRAVMEARRDVVDQSGVVVSQRAATCLE